MEWIIGDICKFFDLPNCTYCKIDSYSWNGKWSTASVSSGWSQKWSKIVCLELFQLRDWLQRCCCGRPTPVLLHLHNCRPLKHVSHPLHICIPTLLLHVRLQIGFCKCKIAPAAFVLLPNYCSPLKPAAHTYCNSFGNNWGFSAPEWVGLNLVVTVSNMGIGNLDLCVCIRVLLHWFHLHTIIYDARLQWIVH